MINMRAMRTMIPTMPKVTPTPALFAKKPVGAGVGVALLVDTGPRVFVGCKLDVLVPPPRYDIVPGW
jgi:hypothetical protein